jgi:hypothetical protein
MVYVGVDLHRKRSLKGTESLDPLVKQRVRTHG